MSSLITIFLHIKTGSKSELISFDKLLSNPNFVVITTIEIIKEIIEKSRRSKYKVYRLNTSLFLIHRDEFDLPVYMNKLTQLNQREVREITKTSQRPYIKLSDYIDQTYLVDIFLYGLDKIIYDQNQYALKITRIVGMRIRPFNNFLMDLTKCNIRNLILNSRYLNGKYITQLFRKSQFPFNIIARSHLESTEKYPMDISKPPPDIKSPNALASYIYNIDIIQKPISPIIRYSYDNEFRLMYLEHQLKYINIIDSNAADIDKGISYVILNNLKIEKIILNKIPTMILSGVFGFQQHVISKIDSTPLGIMNAMQLYRSFTKDIHSINTKMFIINSFEYIDQNKVNKIRYNIRILNLVIFDNDIQKYIRFHILFTLKNKYFLRKPPVDDWVKYGLPSNIKRVV